MIDKQRDVIEAPLGDRQLIVVKLRSSLEAQRFAKWMTSGEGWDAFDRWLDQR